KPIHLLLWFCCYFLCTSCQDKTRPNEDEMGINSLLPSPSSRLLEASLVVSSPLSSFGRVLSWQDVHRK
ncbi:MAG: hypothetical protein RIE86_08215, partial [Imperialibacter sp.]|uniref:hypothetical protein n=1 Tax=Imperialibacter sp. TaxID=2038411 RepID=UPI0032EC9472